MASSVSERLAGSGVWRQCSGFHIANQYASAQCIGDCAVAPGLVKALLINWVSYGVVSKSKSSDGIAKKTHTSSIITAAAEKTPIIRTPINNTTILRRSLRRLRGVRIRKNKGARRAIDIPPIAARQPTPKKMASPRDESSIGSPASIGISANAMQRAVCLPAVMPANRRNGSFRLNWIGRLIAGA